MDIAEGHKLVSWSDIGKALSENAHRWASYLAENGPDSRLEDWYVSMLDQEAARSTDGNIGVRLIDVRPDGIEIEHTDDFTSRVLRVAAPPLRDTHTHECDNCGANFSCACGHPEEERMDCGACKREDEQVEA